MRPRFDTVIVLFKPLVPGHPHCAIFLMNRGGLGLIRGVSDTMIHPECPQMATNTPTVPPQMIPIRLR